MKKIFVIIFIIIIFNSVDSKVNTEIKNAAYSLIIPGSGLISYNNKATKVFISSEIIIAASCVFTSFESINYNNNAIDFASINLNKNVSIYPDYLLTKMELYTSSDEYNEILPSKARDLYPDDIEKQLAYIDEHTIPDSLSWEWNDEEILDEYYNMRKTSRIYDQIFIASISALVINHISSAIFTYFDIRNKLNIDIETTGIINTNNIKLSIKIGF